MVSYLPAIFIGGIAILFAILTAHMSAVLAYPSAIIGGYLTIIVWSWSPLPNGHGPTGDDGGGYWGFTKQDQHEVVE